MEIAVDHALYGLAWVAFGALHSLLAGDRLRGMFGNFARLTYNLVAVATLVAVLAAGVVLLGDRPAFALPPWLNAVLWVSLAAGLALGAVALRSYDLGRFAGLTQIRDPCTEDDESLRTEGLHRWVRHPLYAAGFLVLIGLAHSPLGAATAVWAGLYLLIGTRIEERRLIARYGDAYRRYRERVPAFVPWRGRAG